MIDPFSRLISSVSKEYKRFSSRNVTRIYLQAGVQSLMHRLIITLREYCVKMEGNGKITRRYGWWEEVGIRDDLDIAKQVHLKTDKPKEKIVVARHIVLNFPPTHVFHSSFGFRSALVACRKAANPRSQRLFTIK